MDVMQKWQSVTIWKYYCMKTKTTKALMVQGNTTTGR
jgi:hypothetical protein